MATDAVSLILRDHREVEKLFKQVERGGSAGTTAFAKVSAMLLAHGHAEEREVYPEIAKLGSEQRDEVRHSEEEHQEVEEMIGRLRAMEPGTDEFGELFATLVEAVQEHVEEEEAEMLPRLKEGVGKRRLNELGKAFSQLREAELEKAEKPVAKRAAARGAGGKKAVGRAARQDLGKMNKQELYAQAKKANIKGRSSMSKQQLARALSRSS